MKIAIYVPSYQFRYTYIIKELNKLFELNNANRQIDIFIVLSKNDSNKSSYYELKKNGILDSRINILEFDVNSIAESFVRLQNPRKFFISDMYMDSVEDVNNIEQEILAGISHCKVPPILFLKIHDKSGSFQRVLDMTKDLRSHFLTVNFNYFDENLEIENVIVENSNERALGLDLYDSLKDGKDVTKILDDFLEKRKSDYESVYDKHCYTDEDLDELESFFDNLG